MSMLVFLDTIEIWKSFDANSVNVSNSKKLRQLTCNTIVYLLYSCPVSFQEPIYIRSRELLAVRAQLIRRKEEQKRELEAKNARNLASPSHLTSPVTV